MDSAYSVSLPDQLQKTPAAWLTAVLGDLDSFLRDHASCEKKAAGMATNVASHYPDKPELLTAMADLAIEELVHYRDVLRLLLARGLQPGPDTRDPYINTLHGQLRRGTDWFLLDRLVLGAIVEARGYERFALLANALEDPALKRFYDRIAASEARHWELFLTLAHRYYPANIIEARLSELITFEGKIMAAQPPRPGLH